METAGLIVFLCGVVGLTAAALWTDLRTRRIPNRLTVPFFFAGLIYQGVFNGFSGIGDGLLGFLVGFGALFVLWIVGGGGGGDVKLMGALATWLGFRMTVAVLIGSTVTVLLITLFVILWSVCTKGTRKTKDRYVATGQERPQHRRAESIQEKAQRRIMAYALPVAIATWSLLAWYYPNY